MKHPGKVNPPVEAGRIQSRLPVRQCSIRHFSSSSGPALAGIAVTADTYRSCIFVIRKM